MEKYLLFVCVSCVLCCCKKHKKRRLSKRKVEFYKLWLFYRTMPYAIRSIFIASILDVVITIVLQNFEAKNEFMVQMADKQLDVVLSIIVSIIIYFFTSHYPNESRKLRVNTFIQNALRNIYAKLKYLPQEIEKEEKTRKEVVLEISVVKEKISSVLAYSNLLSDDILSSLSNIYGYLELNRESVLLSEPKNIADENIKNMLILQDIALFRKPKFVEYLENLKNCFEYEYSIYGLLNIKENASNN